MEHQLYTKFASQILCFMTQSHWGWSGVILEQHRSIQAVFLPIQREALKCTNTHTMKINLIWQNPG